MQETAGTLQNFPAKEENNTNVIQHTLRQNCFQEIGENSQQKIKKTIRIFSSISLYDLIALINFNEYKVSVLKLRKCSNRLNFKLKICNICKVPPVTNEFVKQNF